MAPVRAWGILLLALLLIGATGCSNVPEQQETRLRKAAGITTFRILCVKDLWERTSAPKEYGDPKIEAKVAPGPGNLITVALTGPQLVDYLERLSGDAFRGTVFSGDPLAIRMYNAIAPVIDKVREGAPPGAVPEVRVDDPVGGASSSPPTDTPPAKTSPS